jgi:hypothetical protein
MKQLKLKFAEPQDSAQVVNWLNACDGNEFDPGILKYPTLRVFCAYSEEGNEAYIPFHRVLMLESFAPRPGLERSLTAQAMRDFLKGVELVASMEGVREIYFLNADERVGAMAAANGCEEIPYKVYRMKLK